MSVAATELDQCQPLRWCFSDIIGIQNRRASRQMWLRASQTARACSSDIPSPPTGFNLIGKETERGWEQNDDISTLMPSLVRYGLDSGIADERLKIPLAFLERETGLSRHTIVRARRGQPVHARSLQLLKNIVRRVPVRK